MLHMRVHGHGEVIRVLFLSLELGRTNLRSFLQVPREREGEALPSKTEAEEEKHRCLYPREAFPTRLTDRGTRGEGPHMDLAPMGGVHGLGVGGSSKSYVKSFGVLL